MINNVRILLIIERLPNRVYWGCTMGAQVRKQNNGQEKKKRKNKKNEKTPHSIQRVCKKKDLGLVWFVSFHHLISVTHHFKYYTCLTPSLSYHYSIFFTLIVDPYLSLGAVIFFIFYFQLVPRNPKQ